VISTVCAWCGKHLGMKDDGDPTPRVSHGICADCDARVRAEWAMERVARLAGLGTGSVSKGGVVMSTEPGAGVSSSFPSAPALFPQNDAEVSQ